MGGGTAAISAPAVKSWGSLAYFRRAHRHLLEIYCFTAPVKANSLNSTNGKLLTGCSPHFPRLQNLKLCPRVWTREQLT